MKATDSGYCTRFTGLTPTKNLTKMIMSEPEKKTTTLDYTVDFPALPDAPSATSTSSSVPAGVLTGPAQQPSIKSSVVTEAFKLSAEERASRGFGKAFGGTVSEEQQKCNQIAQLTGLFPSKFNSTMNLFRNQD